MFKYYNANPMGRQVNDCSIRAISLACNRSWDETYIVLAEYSREQCITFSEVEFLNDFLSERFKRYDPPSDTYTLKEFLDLRLKGRWLITMNGHITCVIDGVLYDTFDCSDRIIWNIFKVQ